MKRVLIQAGHVAPREPGFESGTGTRGEAEYVTSVQRALVGLLRSDGRFSVVTAPGDLPDGWTGDVAVYLHLDGSASSGAVGCSFGWRDARGQALADRIRNNFAHAGHPNAYIRRDNYTTDLRYYYGFSRTRADTEVVIEHGFGSNPVEFRWLLSHVPETAAAEYHAIRDHLGLAAGWFRDRRVHRVLTREDVTHRNNITVRRTLPDGGVTTWSGWRSDGTGAGPGVVRAIAFEDAWQNHNTKFDIAWQGSWFTTENLGREGVINVARSIWYRYGI